MTKQEKIKKICEEIQKQDNRGTQYPIYCVQSKVRIETNEDNYDTIEWFCEDGKIGGQGEEFDEYVESEYKEKFGKKLDENDGDFESNLEELGYYKVYIKYEYQTYRNAIFLTEKVAQEFIRTNNHNLESPRIWVGSSYRNYELKSIIDYLFETTGIEKPGFWE